MSLVIPSAQRMPKSWDRVGQQKQTMIMRIYVRRPFMGCLSFALSVGLLTSCSKENITDEPVSAALGASDMGAPKALTSFIRVTNWTTSPTFTDGCNLWVNTLNGYVRFFNGASCSLGNGSVSVGGTAAQECFTQVDCTASNQWNWLRASTGPANRKWLRFRFDYGFNHTSGTGHLVTYNHATGIWSVNNAIPGFCWELRNAGDPAAPTPC